MKNPPLFTYCHTSAKEGLPKATTSCYRELRGFSCNSNCAYKINKETTETVCLFVIVGPCVCVWGTLLTNNSLWHIFVGWRFTLRNSFHRGDPFVQGTSGYAQSWRRDPDQAIWCLGPVLSHTQWMSSVISACRYQAKPFQELEVRKAITHWQSLWN